MREIKYRGICVETKKWVYGDLTKLSIIDPFTYISIGFGYKVDDPRIGKAIKVFPDSVGQLTGLKDNHDKDIYEGDIVTVEYGKGQVIYHVGCFMIVWLDDTEANSEPLGFTTKSHNMGRMRKDLEVIGNAHENPDLIK